MRNHDRVEAGDAARPKVRSDYIFAEVELRTAPPDGAARVDEHSAALRHYQQDGVSLAHIDAVTSRTPARVPGFGEMKASARDANNNATSPVTASSARRRAHNIARMSAAEAAAIIRNDGVAMRRSARRKPPRPWTVPVIASRAIVVRSAGSFASTGGI